MQLNEPFAPLKHMSFPSWLVSNLPPPYIQHKLFAKTEFMLNLLHPITTWAYGMQSHHPWQTHQAQSWDLPGCDGFNIGPLLENFHCFQCINRKTKAIVISNTVEFMHSYHMQPTLIPADHITNAINMPMPVIIPVSQPISVSSQAKPSPFFQVSHQGFWETLPRVH